MELLSMDKVIKEGHFCTSCRYHKDQDDCFDKCNSFLDNKPRKKKEEVKEDE
jgi:hypothetical protein